MQQEQESNEEHIFFKVPSKSKSSNVIVDGKDEAASVGFQRPTKRLRVNTVESLGENSQEVSFRDEESAAEDRVASLQPIETPVATFSPAQDDTDLPIEDQARQMGWVPKDEYKGKNKWVDADTFVEKGSFFRKIDAQNKELKELRQVTKNVLDTMSKAEERAYSKALTELENRKNAAYDVNTYKQVDQQINELNKQYSNIKPVKTPVHQLPEWKEFESKNMYIHNTDLKSMTIKKHMEMLSNDFAVKNPGVSPDIELKYVHDQVRKDFPDYEPFRAERQSEDRQDAPSKVAALRTTNKPANRSKATPIDRISRLPPAEAMTAQYLERQGQYDQLEVYLSTVESNLGRK